MKNKKIMIGIIICMLMICINIGYLFAKKEYSKIAEKEEERVIVYPDGSPYVYVKRTKEEQEIRDEENSALLKKMALEREETKEEYVKGEPSIYKPEDFYGTWVAVKLAITNCFGGSSKEENISSMIETIEKILTEPNSYFGRKLVLHKNEPIEIYLTDGRGYREDPDSNRYNQLDLGESGLYQIVNKNKLVDRYGSLYQSMLIYVREEEAKKLDKYIIEIPYNIKSTYCGSDEKPDKTHIKELDEYANKLMSEGKFTIIRGYARNSAIDNE
jgi:hypothetical protein